MRIINDHIKALFLRLITVLFLFTICRILFFIFNYHFFDQVGVFAWFGGLYYDLVTISLVNILFILLSVLPLPFRTNRWHQLIIKIIYVVTNGLAIAINCADIEYFKFTFKRTTADFFFLIGGGEDLPRLFTSLFLEFWYILFIFFCLLYLLFFLYKKIPSPVTKTTLFNFKQWSVAIVIISSTVIVGRGGFGLRPVSIINAGIFTPTRNIPLVLNSAFTLIKTYGKEGLTPYHYYSEDEAIQIYNPVHNFHSDSSRKNMNVVLIIMESFSAEYMGCITGKTSYTPFLDSLAKEGLLFKNAFANGKKSIEGIPAAVAGIPIMMNSPFISSAYSGNNMTSLPNRLGKMGYSSSFYHGAKNGSMGFAGFMNLMGVDAYYGRTEYGNDADHDGTWGIFDEPMMQYWANGLDTQKKPFFSALFSLTSHPPYPLPEKYQNVFKEGTLPIHKVIRYSDYSLRQFFKRVEKSDWFNNTVFVICADHTSTAEAPEYLTNIGTYRIPLIFFTPNGDLKGVDTDVAQQIDIMPTVLNYIGYQRDYISFGHDLLHDNQRFAVQYLNNFYQIIKGDYVLLFDGEKTVTFNNYKKDPLLQTNLADDKSESLLKMERLLKAYIQQHNKRMIGNQMLLP